MIVSAIWIEPVASDKLPALTRASPSTFDAVFQLLSILLSSRSHASRSCTLCIWFSNISRAFCAHEFAALFLEAWEDPPLLDAAPDWPAAFSKLHPANPRSTCQVSYLFYLLLSSRPVQGASSPWTEAPMQPAHKLRNLTTIYQFSRRSYFRWSVPDSCSTGCRHWFAPTPVFGLPTNHLLLSGKDRSRRAWHCC